MARAGRSAASGRRVQQQRQADRVEGKRLFRPPTRGRGASGLPMTFARTPGCPGNRCTQSDGLADCGAASARKSVRHHPRSGHMQDRLCSLLPAVTPGDDEVRVGAFQGQERFAPVRQYLHRERQLPVHGRRVFHEERERLGRGVQRGEIVEQQAELIGVSLVGFHVPGDPHEHDHHAVFREGRLPGGPPGHAGQPPAKKKAGENVAAAHEGWRTRCQFVQRWAIKIGCPAARGLFFCSHGTPLPCPDLGARSRTATECRGYRRKRLTPSSNALIADPHP